MITFLFGENNYLIRQKLREISSNFEVKEAIERYEGESISEENFQGVFGGLTLFASQRLVIISDLSRNKKLWTDIAEKLTEIPDETHVVIVEESPDKRTKTFKQLQKIAHVIEAKNLSEPELLRWLVQEAEERGEKLDHETAKSLIDRIGLDQWQLHFALEKLQGAPTITPQLIKEVTEASPESNVFTAIDAVVKKQPVELQELLISLQATEDAYFFFGLLTNQLFQLIALAVSTKSSNDVAKDLKAHPYPLQKMQPLARQLNKKEMQFIAKTLSECDDRLKRSSVEPWVVVGHAMMKLAQREA